MKIFRYLYQILRGFLDLCQDNPCFVYFLVGFFGGILIILYLCFIDGRIFG